MKTIKLTSYIRCYTVSGSDVKPRYRENKYPECDEQWDITRKTGVNISGQQHTWLSSQHIQVSECLQVVPISTMCTIKYCVNLNLGFLNSNIQSNLLSLLCKGNLGKKAHSIAAMASGSELRVYRPPPMKSSPRAMLIAMWEP